jgi:hypothetical protein
VLSGVWFYVSVDSVSSLALPIVVLFVWRVPSLMAQGRSLFVYSLKVEIAGSEEVQL